MDKDQSVSKSPRWQQAQTYEANFWRSFSDNFDPKYLELLAEEVEQQVSHVLPVDETINIIEVGSGPVGIVSYMKQGRRVATDPLNDFFEEHQAYRRFREVARKRGTEFITSRGESLPFDDKSFDLYISDNVLDHVDSPDELFSEAHRVLKPGGVIWLRVNVYHFWGQFIRWIMEQAVIDKGHPYTFSSESLIKLAKRKDFRIVHSHRSSFWQGWKKDCKRAASGNLRAFIQSILFVTRTRHELIIQRKGS